MAKSVAKNTLNLSITGMHCANCVANVEKKYKETPGVLSVTVNLASNSAVVEYDQKQINKKELLFVLDDTQFEASYLADTFDTFSTKNKERQNQHLKLDLIKLIVSIVLTLAILGIHFFMETKFLTSILQLFLTIPVQFWCGWDFLKGAVKSLKNKTANMDVLVAVGTLITFFYSIYACFTSGHPYFETSAMLISFISFGEYIENRAKMRTNLAVEDLVNLIPEKIRVVDSIKDTKTLINAIAIGQKINTWEKNRELVVPGDFVLIDEGENIPADCIVVAGCGKVDESMLTGESELLEKDLDDKIIGGTKLASGMIIGRVYHSSNDSVLSKIVKAVMDAQASKSQTARIADKVASIFVPVVLLIALVTFIVWMSVDTSLFFTRLQHSIMCAVSILTVACPCALVLATPITLTVAMGKGAQLGIIIKDGSILETLCNVGHVVFDKTGTLTKANLDEDESAAKTLRDDAKETISKLQKDFDLKTYMLSGDKASEANRVAEELGIKKANVVSEADPIKKKHYFIELVGSAKAKSDKPSKEKFVYVGDGINDAPAMAYADVSVTLESATDIALESGNVILMHNKLIDLVTAIRLSKASMRKIKQNMIWALCYNVILIPIAAFGLVMPMWCGAIHALSSLIVVFNALLLKRFK